MIDKEYLKRIIKSIPIHRNIVRDVWTKLLASINIFSLFRRLYIFLTEINGFLFRVGT